MTKKDFTEALWARLNGLPEEDIRERLAFYCEIIDDKTEDGISEEVAISELGDIDTIVSQIIADIPLTKIAKEKIKPKRRLSWWEITLLAVGSPIWIALAVSAFAVMISLYAALWSLIISFWAIFVSLAASSLLCILLIWQAQMVGVGATLITAGLSIFAFVGCMEATKCGVWLTKKLTIGVKRLFIGKERTR